MSKTSGQSPKPSYRKQYRSASSLRLPKYRHHKASGRGIIRFQPLFGPRDIYLPGAYQSPESKAAYEDYCRQIVDHQLAEASADRRPLKDHAMIPQMVTAFLAWASKYYGAKTSHFNHFTVIAELLCTSHPHTRCAQFGPLAIKSLRSRMVDKGWSRSHINAQVNRVRRIFSWGVENEWVSADVTAALREVQPLRKGKSDVRETAPVQPAKWSDVKRCLTYMPPMLAAMVEVHYLTGMRSDELTRMRTSDLDRTDDVWVYQPLEHKTAHRGKTKVICIGPRAQELIAPYLDGDGFIFTPRKAIQEHAAARAKGRRTKETPSSRKAKERPSTRTLGERYNSRSYLHAIRYAFEKAKAAGVKLTHWHPHQLRHARATETRERYGIEGAQAQLGNTLDATEIYAQRSVNIAKRIVRETG